MNERIFKIQTSIDKSKHLVYDRKKEFFGEFGFDDVLFVLVGYKGYVLAIVNKQGKLQIRRKLQKSEWPIW